MKKKRHAKKRKQKRPGRNSPKYFILSLLLASLLATVPISAQETTYPFKSGEYALYGAYYNWNFIWIQSGEVEFKADTVQYQKQKAWHLKAVGKTFKAYDLFYSVRDTFEAYNSLDTFAPLYSRRVLHHGGKSSIHQYLFNHTTNKMDVKIVQEHKTTYTAQLPVMKNTYDLLATAYHFRKYDFDKLIKDQKVSYRMILDRKVEDLYFRYLGKENVKTRTGKVYRCQKVSVFLLQGDFFPEGEYMKIWFTDDLNHLPVQVETKIQVGSVKALLIETKSLKYPLLSLKK